VRHGGRRVSALDLLGTGFTLLTGDDSAGRFDAATVTSAALGVPIGIHRVGREGDVVDAHGVRAHTIGLAPDGAILVRTDDFVG
jgi:putative polyketide hydroxylase